MRDACKEQALLRVDQILFRFNPQLGTTNRAGHLSSTVVPDAFLLQVDIAAIAQRLGDIGIGEMGHGMLLLWTSLSQPQPAGVLG